MTTVRIVPMKQKTEEPEDMSREQVRAIKKEFTNLCKKHGILPSHGQVEIIIVDGEVVTISATSCVRIK